MTPMSKPTDLEKEIQRQKLMDQITYAGMLNAAQWPDESYDAWMERRARQSLEYNSLLQQLARLA